MTRVVWRRLYFSKHTSHRGFCLDRGDDLSAGTWTKTLMPLGADGDLMQEKVDFSMKKENGAGAAWEVVGVGWKAPRKELLVK